MNKIFAIFIVLFITSCSATGPLYEKPTEELNNTSRVYFYRINALAGGAWPDDFYIDDKLVASLRTGGYTYITISPGVHKIHPFTKKADPKLIFEIDAQPNMEYFFRRDSGSVKVPTDAILQNKNTHLKTATQGAIPELLTNLSFMLVKSEFAVNELKQGFKYQSPVVKYLE